LHLRAQKVVAVRLFARLALLLAVACAALPAGAQAPETIHLGVGPVDTAIPLYYAAKAGLYKKYGLDVELVKVPNGATTVAAIAGGTLQLGQGSPLAVVTAVGKGGLPLTVIGTISSYVAEHPDYALLVLANSPIHTAKDLEGQTLAAVSLKDQNALATFAWLDAQGVDRAKLKYVEIPASATEAAMEQGRVVAATFYEPFFSAFTSTGKLRVLAYPYDAIGKRFADSVLFGNSAWVNAHPDAVGKFLRAAQDAAAYVGGHENETPALAGEFIGVDPATVAHVRHGLRGVYILPGDLQPMIDAAAKYDVIPKAFPAQTMICPCALRR
jgi:NitT/TauT family transport system substrate-binding protein